VRETGRGRWNRPRAHNRWCPSIVPTEGARSGWSSPMVLTGGGVAVFGLIALIARQATGESPFIPREFLRSSRYLAIVGMSFVVMSAYLAPIIGLPVLLSAIHGLSALEVGLVMLPRAILTSLCGVLSGRLTDRRRVRLPTWIGSPLMLLAILGLSTYAGSAPWVIAGLSGILGVGFGFANTPPAVAASCVDRCWRLH